MKLESWYRLSDALEYYKSKGYVYLDVPWDVAPEISAITCPDPNGEIKYGDNVLVGSAEQSFLSVYKNLAKQCKYFAITPCFRKESELNDLTRPYFMKLELFSKNVDYLHSMIFDAYSYFSSNIEAVMIPTVEGYDIVSYKRKIELGSYGVRNREGMCWIYGTGLAEPRLTNTKPHEEALVLY